MTTVVVSTVNTGSAELDPLLPSDLDGEARRIGAQLRDLLGSVAATKERVTFVVPLAASASVQGTKLVSQLNDVARSQLNEPTAPMDVKADAQRTLQRVQVLDQELQAALSSAQQTLSVLPLRAEALAQRARTLLDDGTLSPPVFVPAAIVPQKQPAASAVASEPSNQPARTAARGSAVWGWYVAAGAAAVVTAVGIGVNLKANAERSRCEDSAAFGCSNYNRIRQERDLGIVMWSAGAALTASFLTVAFLTDPVDPRAGSQQRAALWCSPGYAGASCQGTY